MAKYTHLRPDKDIPTPSGHYTPGEEKRLNIDGREVLYIIREAVVDASCCGVADFTSALVPGYVVTRDPGDKEDGTKVFEVESVSSRSARKKIRKMLEETENVAQVEFW
jgi:hypothetical protein